MPYQHLLVAIDLSPRSHQVVSRAAQIALRNKATLHIIHVIEHSPIAYGGEFSIPIDVNLEHTIESKSRESLAELGSEFNTPEAHQYVINGSVKHTVVDLANKLNIYLIILGTHGHHGIDKLLGSRANAILHAAKCDVLAVRAKD